MTRNQPIYDQKQNSSYRFALQTLRSPLPPDQLEGSPNRIHPHIFSRSSQFSEYNSADHPDRSVNRSRHHNIFSQSSHYSEYASGELDLLGVKGVPLREDRNIPRIKGAPPSPDHDLTEIKPIRPVTSFCF